VFRGGSNEGGLCDKVAETELISGVTYEIEGIQSIVVFEKDLIKV
jgi:hypothetical protein